MAVKKTFETKEEALIELERRFQNYLEQKAECETKKINENDRSSEILSERDPELFVQGLTRDLTSGRRFIHEYSDNKDIRRKSNTVVPKFYTHIEELFCPLYKLKNNPAEQKKHLLDMMKDEPLYLMDRCGAEMFVNAVFNGDLDYIRKISVSLQNYCKSHQNTRQQYGIVVKFVSQLVEHKYIPIKGEPLGAQFCSDDAYKIVRTIILEKPALNPLYKDYFARPDKFEIFVSRNFKRVNDHHRMFWLNRSKTLGAKHGIRV